MSRTLRTIHPVRRPSTAGPGAAGAAVALRAELHAAVAAAHGLDPDALRADPDAPAPASALLALLAEGPVRTATDALARVDLLVDELIARMDAARWSPTAAPGAITSVLAASVPAAEAVLLRHARPLPTPTAGGR